MRTALPVTSERANRRGGCGRDPLAVVFLCLSVADLAVLLRSLAERCTVRLRHRPRSWTYDP